MTLNSPFAWMPRHVQVPLCLVLIVATLAFMYGLRKVGAPLDQLLPHGVLDIEMPMSSRRADDINLVLGKAGIEVAQRQTHLDFVFLVLYSVALSMACALLSPALPRRVGMLGMVLAWGALGAGMLDAVENVAMLRMLDGTTSSPWPQISTACAVLKFALALAALGFAAIGGLWRLLRR